MKNDQWYIEQVDDGRYSAKKGGAARASAIEDTQAEAIARAGQIDPAAPIHVARVRTTERGAPDRWRNP